MQFKSADGVWPNARLSVLSTRTWNAQLDDRNTNILLLYRPAAARPAILYIYIHFFPPQRWKYNGQPILSGHFPKPIAYNVITYQN